MDAFGPSLQGQQWTWPAASDVPDPVQVPDLAGKSVADATTALAAVGLSPAVSPTSCGSGEPVNTVGYYEPHVATAGSQVTLCLSNGTAPTGSGQYSYGSGSDGNGSYGNGTNSSGPSPTGSTPSSAPSATASAAPSGGTRSGGTSGSPVRKPRG